MLVVNDTGAGRARVTVDATVTRRAAAQRRAPGDRASPRAGACRSLFPLRAERGRASSSCASRPRWATRTTGSSCSIPVHYPARVETELVARGHTTRRGGDPGDAARRHHARVGVAGGVDRSRRRRGLEEGLRDLVEYPYGCLEQTTSRLIPLVAVEELAKSLKLAGLDGPALQSFIRAGIAKLEKLPDRRGRLLAVGGRQARDLPDRVRAVGPQARVATPVTSCRRAMIDRGMRYLRAQLGRDAEGRRGPCHSELGELGSRAFAVYVLGMLDSPDAGLREQAAREEGGAAALRQGVPGARAGAEPGRAASGGDGPARRVWCARPSRRARRASIREPGGNDLHWYMSDDVRTTAIATDAFLDLRPSEPMLPGLVKGLFGERAHGRWSTTQDNLYALVALTHYVKSRPAAAHRSSATLGDKKVLAGDFRGKTTHIRRATVALDAAKPRDGAAHDPRAGRRGVLLVGAALPARRRRTRRPTRTASTVRREYLDPTTDAPIDPKRRQGRQHGARAGDRVIAGVAQPPGGRRSGAGGARADQHAAGHQRRRTQKRRAARAGRAATTWTMVAAELPRDARRSRAGVHRRLLPGARVVRLPGARDDGRDVRRPRDVGRGDVRAGDRARAPRRARSW